MDFSEIPRCDDMYCERDVTNGKPTFADRAVLLGRVGAMKNSVSMMLYESPIIPFPKNFVKISANLVPIVVFATVFASERTRKRSQGVTLLNPEKLSFISMVPVMFAANIVINKKATGEQMSNITPAIEVTKIIII
jgi:hypothetical protein